MAFPFVSDLDTPLLMLSGADCFTLRDACAGVQVFGGIGSGKTSGSGQALAGAYLRAGMGGLVLTAKPEEVDLWRFYARRNGREKSLILFDETQGFNFMDYEIARQGPRGTGSLVDCLMRVLESSDTAAGITGNAGDQFWSQASRQCLTYSLPLIYSAHGNLSVPNVIDFVTSAATNAEQYLDAGWAGSSYAAHTLRRAVDAPAVPMGDEREVRGLMEYWFKQWPAIPDRTRGNIVISLSTKLDRFRHGRLRECFSGRTTIVPEMTYHGAIIVMGMPALTWNDDGVVGQNLMKYMWQRAVESRNGLPPVQRERPVFLFADESQTFLHPNDEAFLSTCRGSRACVVFLTQNLPAYYARLGKDKTDAVDGLVGKFATQVFHSNACHRTNEFASKLIGRGLQWRATEGKSLGTSRSRGMNEGSSENRGTSRGHGSSSGGFSDMRGSFSHNSGSNDGSGESWGSNVNQGSNEGTSWSQAEHIDNLVEPRFFATSLRTGGPANGNQVSALWFQAGARFAAAGGDNAMVVTFDQEGGR